MNLSGKDKHVILAVIGIVLCYLSYQFVFVSLSDKADKVNAQILEADKEIESLQMYKNNIDTYKSDIETFKTETSKVMSAVPKDITMESVISYLQNLWSKYTFSVSKINIGSPTTVYTFSDGVSKAFAWNLSIEYSTDYETLKVLLDKITNDETARMTINNMTMNYSSDDGGVSGSLELVVYTTTSELGRDYVTPDFGIDLGTSDIFKSTSD